MFSIQSLKKNPQDSLLKRVPTRIWTQKWVVFHCALRSILECSPGQWSLLPESLKSTPLASVASSGGCLNSRSRLPTETLTHLLREPLTPLPCTWLQDPRAGIGRDSVTFLTLGGSLPLGVEALLNHPPPPGKWEQKPDLPIDPMPFETWLISVLR